MEATPGSNRQGSYLKTRLYRIWEKFIEGKPAACEEWRNNATEFIAWAQAHGYRDNKNLMRFHGVGDYTPENCFWGSKSRQYATKRFLTAGGITQSLAEWARDTGISYKTILYRVDTGKTPEQALGIEPIPKGRKRK